MSRLEIFFALPEFPVYAILLIVYTAVAVAFVVGMADANMEGDTDDFEELGLD